jgi:mono/diheme cytochrome c family protein
MAHLRLTTAQSYALALLVAMLVFSACAGNEPKDSDTASPMPVITVMGEEASAETLARGAELYAANCQSCHGGATGGNLKDIPPPHNANGHTWHHADQQLMNMVLNGIPFSLEEQKMPAFRDKLTEEEVKAILAYIKTWWTEEQRESQKEVTRQWNQ